MESGDGDGDGDGDLTLRKMSRDDGGTCMEESDKLII